MTEKNFFKINIFGIIFILILTAVMMIIIDPYFHYHKPLSFLSYKLGNQRYINNGIVKHFDYNAVITGTSMTENFKSSQFDKLFNVNSIKVPFSGGSYKEINDNIEAALKSNKNIKYILRGLDYGLINREHDSMRYNSYPTYLYDSNIFNDFKYWWNKEILVKGVAVNIVYTLLKKSTTSFDEYSRWNESFIPGKTSVLKEYKRLEKENIKKSLSKEDCERINKNYRRKCNKITKRISKCKIYIFYYTLQYSLF